MTKVRDLEKEFRKYLDTIRIIDTHEHLITEQEFCSEAIDFSSLLLNSVKSSLVSAGMPPGELDKLQNDSKMSPNDKWSILDPFWKYIRGTGGARSIERALADLYGIEHLDADTVEAVSEKMSASRRAGYYREVFDRAGIAVALWNRVDHCGPIPRMWTPVFDQSLFIQDLLSPYLRLDLQRSSYFHAAAFQEWKDGWEKEIYCLDDFLGAIEERFNAFAAQAAALKIGIAYLRHLRFEDRARSDVEPLFNRLLNQGWERNASPLVLEELYTIQDYLVHFSMRLCDRHHLPVKFHTGHLEGNGNTLGNARASLLANLFFKYPNIRFDIYHISYPYQEEVVSLVANFPNVSVDFCWMWTLIPNAARRALSDFLDAVPANKIHGFGGDSIMIEGTYGHAMLAKDEIAKVLAQKVIEGSLTEQRAETVARWLLRDNPINWFGLEKKASAALG